MVAIFSLLFSGLQWWAAKRAVDIANQARVDAIASGTQEKLDAQQRFNQQRADAASALKAQSDRADRANQLSEALAANNRKALAIMQRTYAASRPMILINTADAVLMPDKHALVYKISVINDGMISAQNYLGGCYCLVGASQMVSEADPVAKPITLGSHDAIGVCYGAIRSEKFDDIQAGRTTLDIYLQASYDGPTAEYKYCNHQRYLPYETAFMNLGEDCKDIPASARPRRIP
jgi:hypothetical protein